MYMDRLKLRIPACWLYRESAFFNIDSAGCTACVWKSKVFDVFIRHQTPSQFFWCQAQIPRSSDSHRTCLPAAQRLQDMFQVLWEKQAWLGILSNYLHPSFVSEDDQTGPDKGSGVGNLTIPNVARLGLVSGLTGGVSQFWADEAIEAAGVSFASRWRLFHLGPMRPLKPLEFQVQAVGAYFAWADEAN